MATELIQGISQAQQVPKRISLELNLVLGVFCQQYPCQDRESMFTVNNLLLVVTKSGWEICAGNLSLIDGLLWFAFGL